MIRIVNALQVLRQLRGDVRGRNGPYGRRLVLPKLREDERAQRSLRQDVSVEAPCSLPGVERHLVVKGAQSRRVGEKRPLTWREVSGQLQGGRNGRELDLEGRGPTSGDDLAAAPEQANVVVCQLGDREAVQQATERRRLAGPLVADGQCCTPVGHHAAGMNQDMAAPL